MSSSKELETEMSMTWFATLAAGILSLIGVGGIFATAAFEDARLRKRSFEVGTYGLTLGGIVLMLGSFAGWLPSDDLFGGVLMVLFGTGSASLPAKSSNTETPDDSAR